jgi:leucine-rich repeat protein SHOC2
MEQAKLEQIIEQARLEQATNLCLHLSHESSILPESLGKLTHLTRLYIRSHELKIFPNSLGNLVNLTHLKIDSNKTIFSEELTALVSLVELLMVSNQIEHLPNSIGNLVNLTSLNLNSNCISIIPDSLGNLTSLTYLGLYSNQLTTIPDSIGNLRSLIHLDLGYNNLTNIPNSIVTLRNLSQLDLRNNKLTKIPTILGDLACLTNLYLDDNLLTDLSILQNFPSLSAVSYFNVILPRRYWDKFSEWKSEWLLDEANTKIRQILIEQLGYEKIFKDLNSLILDTWREYTLLKIDDIEEIYYDGIEPGKRIFSHTEPIVLLKMTCPSTQHIHILRVPPEMTSAEAAITWVNHGIHPDEFAVQT